MQLQQLDLGLNAFNRCVQQDMEIGTCVSTYTVSLIYNVRCMDLF